MDSAGKQAQKAGKPGTGLRNLRLWSGLLSAAAGLVIAIATLLGGFDSADRWFSDIAFRLGAHPPSGQLVLVEIDARSLKKLNRWPWSRAYHAALIGRLSQAGARAIAFDVDFSAASSFAADASLAQAIAASRSRVVLAGFAQIARATESPTLSFSRPLEGLREHAETGLVNVFADADGEPRQYRRHEDRLPGSPATLAALLAGPPAEAGPADDIPNRFGIDYGIDVSRIPRLSYVDVLTGHFDPALVRGRAVLVGATAIELGDHFLTPRGILAGVEVQALAYETLALHRPVLPLGIGPVLAVLAVLIALCHCAMWPSWPRGLAAAFGAAAIIPLLDFVTVNAFAVTLAPAPWLAGIGAAGLIALICHIERHAAGALQDRQAAQRQKALMESVFRDSFDGILIVDAEGKVEVANEAAARMLEIDIADMLGRSIEALLPGFVLAPAEDEAARSHAVAVPGAAGTRNLAVVVSRSKVKLGAKLPAGRGARDAAPERYVVTFRDESARLAMEAAREATVRELQAATAAKNQFLARMSHELRTPLSAIIGFATIIAEQKIGPIGNAKYAEYAADIHQGGERLLDLVSDIIDVARIEALQYEVHPEALEVRSLLASCVAAVRQRGACEERSFQVEVEAGAEVMVSDQQVLRRALAKLLSNAVKFTAADGRITLRATGDGAAGIVLAVEDNGIGIPEAALPSVVAAFSQVAGGLDRRHEGSGLGLYFAKRLIELLEGRLEIESRAGAGTTVRLIAPNCLVHASQAA